MLLPEESYTVIMWTFSSHFKVYVCGGHLQGLVDFEYLGAGVSGIVDHLT